MKAINLLAPAHEHEFEAALGLPEALPAGERLLWQGSPSAWVLARDALWWDKVAAYFGLLLAWRLGSLWADGADAAAWSQALARMLPLMALALGLLGGLAWLMARTTVYTLTSRRVVMRIGVVLSITFNLPLHCLQGAALHRRRGGRGDLALQLAPGDHIAYLHLWPHARPWHLRHPQPLLRGLPEAEQVARQLTEAWQAQAPQAPKAPQSPQP